MSSIVVAGDTSGSVTLTAPLVAGTTVLTLPATSGTVLTSATGQTLTSPVIAGTPTGVGVLTSGTAVASTSGTSIDFTGIPSWVKRVTVMLNGVSLAAGTTNIVFRLGTSGGIVSTGYLARQANIVATTSNGSNETVGFVLGSGGSAADIFYGSIIFTHLNANIWCAQGILSQTGATSYTSVPSGAISLGGALDRIRITTVNGTDTFDAGSINILYE